jgi:anti-anti-sigma factor
MGLSGRLDTLTAPRLEGPLLEALAANNSVVLDCAALEYVSSAGLRVLLAGQKAADAAGHNFELTAVSEDVLDVFDLTGFSDILTIR